VRKDNFIVVVLFCLQGGATAHMVEMVCLELKAGERFQRQNMWIADFWLITAVNLVIDNIKM